jgi:hypothetical protein
MLLHLLIPFRRKKEKRGMPLGLKLSIGCQIVVQPYQCSFSGNPSSICRGFSFRGVCASATTTMNKQPQKRTWCIDRNTALVTWMSYRVCMTTKRSMSSNFVVVSVYKRLHRLGFDSPRQNQSSSDTLFLLFRFAVISGFDSPSIVVSTFCCSTDWGGEHCHCCLSLWR